MRYVLQVIDGGPFCDGQFDLLGDRLMIGRHETADVVLPNATVSKRHAVLTRRGDGYLLEDLMSATGTYVNDVLVREPVPLSEGDTIRVANVRLVYRCVIEER